MAQCKLENRCRQLAHPNDTIFVQSATLFRNLLPRLYSTNEKTESYFCIVQVHSSNHLQ
jgi:hypothetical protein